MSLLDFLWDWEYAIPMSNYNSFQFSIPLTLSNRKSNRGMKNWKGTFLWFLLIEAMSFRIGMWIFAKITKKYLKSVSYKKILEKIGSQKRSRWFHWFQRVAVSVFVIFWMNQYPKYVLKKTNFNRQIVYISDLELNWN